MQKDSLKAIRLGFLGGMAFVLGMAVTGILASELVNGLWRFSANDVLSASEINQNFDTLSDRINAAGSVPVGTILAWHKSFGGTPTLPGGYVECNGQLLGDSASPYNGQRMPNLNGDPSGVNSPDIGAVKSMFLRGGLTSGTGQNDAFQGHYHAITKQTNILEWHRSAPTGSNGIPAGTDDNHREGITGTGYGVFGPITDGTNGTPRIANETRPVSMTVVWIIKVK